MEGWHSHLVQTINSNPNLWKFITKIKSEQTAKELEQNHMNNEAIIVPLTQKLKEKERRLARSKQRYNNNELTHSSMFQRFLILCITKSYTKSNFNRRYDFRELSTIPSSIANFVTKSQHNQKLIEGTLLSYVTLSLALRGRILASDKTVSN